MHSELAIFNLNLFNHFSFLFKSLARPVGVAFVTFATQDQASKVYQDLKRRAIPRNSSLGSILRAHDWAVQSAPRADDINWNQLSTQAKCWWLRFIGINLALFIFLSILTTPAACLSAFYTLSPIRQLQETVRKGTEEYELIVYRVLMIQPSTGPMAVAISTISNF